MLNCETWYPDSIFDGYCPSLSKETFYYTGGTAKPGYADSKIAWLFRLQESICKTITFPKVPLVSLVFSPAFMFYIEIYALGYLIYRRRLNCASVILCALVLHMGTFFCPIVVLRYNLLSFLVAPIALGLILNPNAFSYEKI